MHSFADWFIQIWAGTHEFDSYINIPSHQARVLICFNFPLFGVPTIFVQGGILNICAPHEFGSTIEFMMHDEKKKRVNIQKRCEWTS